MLGSVAEGLEPSSVYGFGQVYILLQGVSYYVVIVF